MAEGTSLRGAGVETHTHTHTLHNIVPDCCCPGPGHLVTMSGWLLGGLLAGPSWPVARWFYFALNFRVNISFFVCFLCLCLVGKALWFKHFAFAPIRDYFRRYFLFVVTKIHWMNEWMNHAPLLQWRNVEKEKWTNSYHCSCLAARYRISSNFTIWNYSKLYEFSFERTLQEIRGVLKECSEL